MLRYRTQPWRRATIRAGALDQWLDDDDNLRRARFNKLFYADIARATRITANTAEELAELGDDDALSEYESLINNLERHCQRAKPCVVPT